MNASRLSRLTLNLLVLVSAAMGLRTSCAADLSAEEKQQGFASLFDGKSLAGWIGATEDYAIEHGELVSSPKAKGNLWTDKEYSDFVLRFDFQLTPGANNGVGIRSPLKGPAHYDGIEIQILDDPDPVYKNIETWQHHGSVYGIVPAKTGHLKPVGQWNSEEIVAQGRRIKVVLNGATIVDADLDEALKSGAIDGHEHPGAKRAAGHIGWLGHGSRVALRNIRVKDLAK
jgi:hypothetical protein